MLHPIRPTTRHLANMQMSILFHGSRLFRGDIDRFSMFALIVRAALDRSDRAGTISAHSLALSMGRPFETVRRHVNALIVAGLCERTPGGVTIAGAAWERADVAVLLQVAHDALVRLIVDLNLTAGTPVPGVRYGVPAGIQAAVDMMLGTLDANRGVHGDALGVVLFATVLHGNIQRYYTHRPVAAGEDPAFHPYQALRSSEIARALSIPESTVRRRIAIAAAPGGTMERAGVGVVVSLDWLAGPVATQVAATTVAGLRRVVARLAGNGFPFDLSHTAYVAGRPPNVVID